MKDIFINKFAIILKGGDIINKFKVNDRVIAIKDVDDGYYKTKNEIGTIVAMSNKRESYYIVRFDNYIADAWGDKDLGIETGHCLYIINDEIKLYDSENPVKIENTPNAVSYIVDTQYDCYIKSQTISNEEKLAVKKFIEFMRRNLNEIRDTEHCQEIKQQERNDVIE